MPIVTPHVQRLQRYHDNDDILLTQRNTQTPANILANHLHGDPHNKTSPKQLLCFIDTHTHTRTEREREREREREIRTDRHDTTSFLYRGS